MSHARVTSSTQELARDRTELASARTDLAEERTFAAWLRTGLACMGGGFALAKTATGHPFAPLGQWAGIGLVLAGLMIHLGAVRESRSLWKKSPRGQIPAWALWWVLPIITLVALALVVLLVSDMFVDARDP